MEVVYPGDNFGGCWFSNLGKTEISMTDLSMKSIDTSVRPGLLIDWF
jgi:hypothetical protein